jgi:lipopolysaccharide heptosyltransferase II
MNRLVILAPNWLGDAVMALPAIADVRREWPRAEISVAAKPAIAPLFHLVAGVNGVVDVEHLGAGFDTALLLPNSFRSALLVTRARVPERWGYRTEWRAPLLTRAIEPVRGLHQAEYYQRLVYALGIDNGAIDPRLAVPQSARDAGARALAEAGWDGVAPLVALAPGAAYGGAKRWPPERFAELADALASDGVQSVIIGTAADAATERDLIHVLRSRGRTAGIVSVVGKTDIPTLAGVLVTCRTLVTNDSGVMHLAAAVGIPVTAVFGPTDEHATRPLGDGHAVIAHHVWCRPCLLRECPIDHRCMRGIAAAEVAAAARRIL